MHVLRLYGAGDLRLSEEPDPTPGSGESLMRVEAVGICGSDLHWVEDGAIGDARLSRPLVLGHEFAGTVLTGELSGRLVAVEPAINCQVCEFCAEGNPNFCRSLQFAGHDQNDGAFRDVLSWPTRLMYPLPEGFDAAQGAMLEPLGVALHTVDLGHLRVGMRVAVIGCGPIGLLILQLARLAGARLLVATDLHQHRLVAARNFGATQTWLADGAGGEVPAIESSIGDQGLDVVFEAAGDDAAVRAAIDLVKPGGKIILAGIPSGDTIQFSASVSRRKGVTIKLVRRMKHTYPRAVGLVESGLVDVASIVTHRFPMGAYGEAFAIASRRDGLKVVLRP
jgi:L-iditol 2-dehydrogenase